MSKFLAIFRARTMEFVRDRGTLIWNIAFPVLLIFGFSFAFGGGNESLLTVGVLGETDAPLEFFALESIDTVTYEDLDEAMEKVRFHQIDLLIDQSQDTFYVNESSSNGALARTLLTAMHPGQFRQETVTGRAVRYVDWVVPGLIGMNMMFSGVFGVGFVLVRYRKNGVLKRLKATPVTPFEFVSAQVASRFIIVIATSVLVFVGTNLALGFMMLGSYLLLLLLTFLAVFCMISLGLVFATRIKSEELASGLMNVIIFPMVLVSGVFFSLETAPPVLRSISRGFPLTHFVDSARMIMLEGAGLVEIAPSLLVLLGFTVVFLVLSSVLFRWE
jgi:ABC-type multidrug transport system permease subunit